MTNHKTIEIPPNFRNAVVIKLILVSVKEGDGTKEKPYTLVHYYCDFDGNILFSGQPKDSL